jgi:hypothetical protein
VNRAKKSIVETFSRAYEAASPEEQAALRVWMRDVILPQKKPRKNLKTVEEMREGYHRRM